MAETRIRLDKQIQKAPGNKYVPLSDANGELQYVPISGIVEATQTLTHLNSVEVLNGNLIIKYTGENGIQQVVSTPLAFNQTDVQVSGAQLENPASGIYRLVITESDGTTNTVDLSSLLAVVTQNTASVLLSGNGTPQSPLSAQLSQAFLDAIPRALDGFSDVNTPMAIISQEVQKGGAVVLSWDQATSQWIPKSIDLAAQGLPALAAVEVTEIFRDLASGNSVNLQYPISQINTATLKVYRNGLRQDPATDYRLEDIAPNSLFVPIPFSDGFNEKLIVEYQLKS